MSALGITALPTWDVHGCVRAKRRADDTLGLLTGGPTDIYSHPLILFHFDSTAFDIWPCMHKLWMDTIGATKINMVGRLSNNAGPK